MPHYRLACTACGKRHDPGVDALRCRSCYAPLEVAYAVGGRLGPMGMPTPVHDPDNAVSLGEGRTPCIELPRMAHALGVGRLVAKLEYANPTGSFKDRGAAVMLSVMREFGVKELAEDSSGNAGASVAAYAARAGIVAHIFAPATAPAAKLGQIKVYGAQLHAIPGPREAATDAAVAFQQEQRIPYASHNLSPYFVEGTKSFAYEAAEQLEDGLPMDVAMPVGNGSLFIGAWKGFRELLAAGRATRMPRLHAIQAVAAMPIAAAHKDQPWSPSGQRTIAGGIASVAPPRRDEMLRVLRETRGHAAAIEDADILRWQRLLAEQEGVYCEPTSAAVFAGIARLVAEGALDAKSSILAPITGSGLKDVPPTGKPPSR
ncbi:MAG: pyridoxal-phosphate dependent enzyme [SAR202 cluster bacterium]|nr:pyridoxal-phosphate dependent enzyme [SAR202 cluster bacterium]